jgi:hypothetical protein
LEEIVLKREASVTSAEALDQINAAYPDAEILSFRRIKEAGNSSEFFITRVRVAAMADEADDVVLDSEDIVVEDKKHEENEEDKMNQIINLLKQLVEDEESEKEPEPIERPKTDAELEMDHEAKPLPEPQEPPFGVSDMGSVSMTPIASIVVERKANVSKKIARLELIREFTPEYKIASIEKKDGVFLATLDKVSAETFGDPDEYEGSSASMDEWAESEAEAQKARRAESEAARQYEDRIVEDILFGDKNDEMGVSTKAPPRFSDEIFNLSPVGRAWLHFLDEAGAPHKELVNMQKFLEQLTPREQGEWIKEQAVRIEDDPRTDFGVGPEGTGPKGQPGKAFRGEMDPSFVKGDKVPRKRKIVLPNYIRKQIDKWEQTYGQGAGKVDDFPVSKDVRAMVQEKQKELGKAEFERLHGDSKKFIDQIRRVNPAAQETWLQTKFAPQEEKSKSQRTRKSIGELDMGNYGLGQVFETMGDTMTPGDAARLFEQRKKIQRGQQQAVAEQPVVEAPVEQVATMDPSQQQEIENEALAIQQKGYEAYTQGDTAEATRLFQQAQLVRSQLGKNAEMPEGTIVR